MKYYKIIILIGLASFFLCGLVISNDKTISGNETKTNNDHTDTIINHNPKISGNQITITTPENKTYVEPRSGFYPATYGFEEEPAGYSNREPVDWVNYDTGGGPGAPYKCGTYIRSSYLGHNKVLFQEDAQDDGNADIRHTFKNGA